MSKAITLRSRLTTRPVYFSGNNILDILIIQRPTGNAEVIFGGRASHRSSKPNGRTRFYVGRSQRPFRPTNSRIKASRKEEGMAESMGDCIEQRAKGW